MKKNLYNNPSSRNHFDQIKKKLIIILVNSHAKKLFFKTQVNLAKDFFIINI